MFVVRVNDSGRLIFSREYSYLPYWEANDSWYFLEKIVPCSGDGPAGMEFQTKGSYLMISGFKSVDCDIAFSTGKNYNADLMKFFMIG